MLRCDLGWILGSSWGQDGAKRGLRGGQEGQKRVKKKESPRLLLRFLWVGGFWGDLGGSWGGLE